MKYGLQKNVIDKISSILETFEEIKQVVLYGSRAMGNYKPASDIDFVLKGNKLNIKILNNISWALDDLYIYNQIKNQCLIRIISVYLCSYYSNKYLCILLVLR